MRRLDVGEVFKLPTSGPGDIFRFLFSGTSGAIASRVEFVVGGQDTVNASHSKRITRLE